MKSKLLLVAVSAFLSFTTLNAQEDAEKALKTAGRSLTSYNMDPAANKAKLDEAKASIDIASASPITAALSKTWVTKGQIYSKMAEKDDNMRLIKPDTKPVSPDAPFIAYTSFKKAFELAVKKWEKSDAITGLTEQLNRLRSAGADYYAAKKYEDAYNNFNGMLVGHKMVKDFGEKSPIEDKDMNTFKFYTGLSAQLAKKNEEAITLYKELAVAKHPEPSLYEGLYMMLTESDAPAAVKYLEEGIKVFPNDNGLLFAQINYYLKNNKLEELISKLKFAIEKEPANMALYTTLGSVYSNLIQIENKNKNEAKAAEYTKAANDLFAQILAKEPNNFEANYSLGEMGYNKAAEVSKELIAIQDDNSAAGQKKYDELKVKMDGLFNQALPYFQKAEAAKPDDYNTLVALKEIYVRTKQYDLSNKCKAKIEALSVKKN